MDRVDIPQGVEVTFRAQLLKEDGAFVVADDVIRAQMRVTDERDTDSQYLEVLDVPEHVFDARTDAAWKQDESGYNFQWTGAALYFPRGSRVYRVELEVWLESQSIQAVETPLRRRWMVHTRGVRG